MRDLPNRELEVRGNLALGPPTGCVSLSTLPVKVKMSATILFQILVGGRKVGIE